jgi:hypothetical protein
MVYRRVFNQGNSSVITFPSYLLERCGVGKGDYFLIEETPGPCLKLTPCSCASVVAIFHHEREMEARRRAEKVGGVIRS